MKKYLFGFTFFFFSLFAFYRTPLNFYQEGSFTSETVDGIALPHSTSAAKSWSAEATAYAGGFSMIEQTASGLVRPRAEKTLGGQVSLTTPVSGLRFGLGAQRLELTGSAVVSDGADNWKSTYASGEYAGARVKLRSEYRKTRIRDADVNFNSYYVYGGYNLSSRLSLHVQFDTSKLDFGVSPGVRRDVPKYYEDKTLGATYSVGPNVMIKGEYHWSKSQLVEPTPFPSALPRAR